MYICVCVCVCLCVCIHIYVYILKSTYLFSFGRYALQRWHAIHPLRVSQRTKSQMHLLASIFFCSFVPISFLCEIATSNVFQTGHA